MLVDREIRAGTPGLTGCSVGFATPPIALLQDAQHPKRKPFASFLQPVDGGWLSDPMPILSR